MVKCTHGSSFQLNAATFILYHNGVAAGKVRSIGSDASRWYVHLSLTRGPERLLDAEERPAYLETECIRADEEHWCWRARAGRTRPECWVSISCPCIKCQ
jgi:hypothetical protein